MASTGEERQIVDFTENIRQDSKWYNAFVEAPQHLFMDRNRNQLKKIRPGSVSLHRYQTFTNDVPCSFALKGEKENNFREFPCTKDAMFKFSIEGGAETPQFSLKFDLTRPSDNARKLSFRIVWTAWGERGYDTYRAQNVPYGNSVQSGSYTFSSRLHGVQVVDCTLTQDLATKVMGVAGSPAYTIMWSHYHPPYTFGFHLPSDALHDFSPSQVAALNAFYQLKNGEMQLKITTRARATIPENWAFMAAMPCPTPGPYPLYDCRYVVDRTGQGSFARVDTIPPVADPNVLAHHGRRIQGWMNMPQAKSYSEPPELLSLQSNAPLQFINEREYEVVKTVGLLREAHHQKINYIDAFNGRYSFAIWPVSSVHGVEPGLDDFFYAVVTAFDEKSIDSLVDQGLSLPEPGTPVSINPKTQASSTSSSHELISTRSNHPSDKGKGKWIGVVIRTPSVPTHVNMPANPICLRVKRPQDLQSAGTFLELSGWITFGQPEVAFVQARSAIRTAMYGNYHRGIPADNYLKLLLLNRSNSTIHLHPPRVQLTPTARDYVSLIKHVLNGEQVSGVESALNPTHSHRNYVTLITGPPGTGKTSVSVRIVLYFLLRNESVLITCGSNKALDVMRDRLIKVMGVRKMSLEGIYRLETDFKEDAETQMAPDIPEFTRKTQEEFAKTVEQLKQCGLDTGEFELLRSSVEASMGSSNQASLGARIISRLEDAKKAKQGLPREGTDEEWTLLWEYIAYQRLLAKSGILFVESVEIPDSMDVQLRGMSTDLMSAKDQADLHKNFLLGLKRAWFNLQEYYLARARVVLCTASTASRKGLRLFQPKILIVEEATQMTESTCLTPMIRYYSSVQKIVLSGDASQLPPTVTSLGRNEFFQSEKLSLFERLLKSGIPNVFLRSQYRMHSNIAEFVSTEFYDNQLITYPEIKHPHSEIFRQVMTKKYGWKAACSYFLSVQNSSVWRRKNGNSAFNPEYIVAIVQLAVAFNNAGIPLTSILVLTYYNEEKHIFRKVFNFVKRSVEVLSVDASQGDERDIVIVSTTRPGGEKYGLGFVADRGRQCVALSRARDGLIVVGDERMGVNKRSEQFKAWGRFVDFHRERGTLVKQQGNRQLLEKDLSIPNGEGYVEWH